MPLYPIGLGDPSPTRDLELTDLQVDDVVFVDDQVRFEARLGGHGFADEPVDVVLTRRPAGSTDPKAAQEVGKTSVKMPPDGQTARVEIRHQPKETGEFVYRLAVAPRPREIQTENNQVEHAVSVRQDKLKVLLVDSEPRYEFRYLLSFLKRDKTIALKAVLQSADPEFSEQEATALPTFPSTKDGPDGLFSFDVIVLGDADISLLGSGPLQNLVDFVEKKGGGLMFVAGEGFDPLSYRGTPLEPLVPIKLAEARNPTASGSRGRAVPSHAHGRGPRPPDLPVRRRRGRIGPRLANPARARLVPGGASQARAGFRAGRPPEPDRLRRPLADPAVPVRRRR